MSLKLFNIRFCYPLTLLALLFLNACDNSGDTSPAPSSPPVEASAIIDPAATTATVNAWRHGEQLSQQCISNSQQLRDGIRQFLDNPTPDTLTQSRTAWRQAHQPVVAFAVFFTLADTNPGMFGELIAYRYNLDAYPIQPGFIDYFDVYQFSGIVNDLAITLSAEALREQHGITDHSDVSIGLHALEYLLWGENGERPLDDFTAIDSVTQEQSQQGLQVVDLPNNRRRVYLQLLTELLVDDCNRLAEFWNDPNGILARNYQALTTPARLQLWQATMSDLLARIEFELPVTETKTENGDTDSDDVAAAETESLPALEEVVVHNPYADGEAQVIAAQLRGVGRLLYGGIDPEQQDPQTHFAAWINADRPVNTETENDNAQAPLLALQSEYNRIMTLLTTQESWPLAETDAEALQALLSALQAAMQPDPADDESTDDSTLNAEEEAEATP